MGDLFISIIGLQVVFLPEKVDIKCQKQHLRLYSDRVQTDLIICSNYFFGLQGPTWKFMELCYLLQFLEWFNLIYLGSFELLW